MATLFMVPLEDLLKIDMGTDGDASTVANNIINHELAGKRSTDNFTDLARFGIACGAVDKADWNGKLEPGEDKILTARGSCGEKVRTASGKLMRSKVCSNSTYSSNKSVIGNALETGVALSTGETDEDGLPIIRGKSEIEKELREGKKKKSPFDIATIGANMAINQFGNMTQKERDDITNIIMTAYNQHRVADTEAA